jgi:23S rRNA (cytosine1962-C5)-methyltransferase
MIQPERHLDRATAASTGPFSVIGELKLLPSRGFADYRLLDSGAGRKLERFGTVVVDRPEPQALWRQRLPAARWTDAHAVFSGEGDEEAGKWRVQTSVPESWPVRLQDITLICRLSAFRHLGLFPEQLPHWTWMLDHIARAKRDSAIERPRVLNLFAYTGAASLLAARAGAEVVHVDASKKAIAWAKENQSASKLGDAPVRWMLEDARKFVAREVRRGRSYHVILIDPPKFGRGPGGEVWDLFEHLPPLMRDCAKLLDVRRSALVLTAYAIRASALSIGQLVAETVGERGGHLETGELAICEESGSRAVATSLYSRWASDAPAA